MKNYSFHTPNTASAVDRQQHLIKGVSLISKGEAEGHGLTVDDVCLNQILASAIEAEKIPVRLDHGSGIEKLCGFLSNFRKSGDKIVGDWKLLSSHPETPLMEERAETMPGCWGLSVAFAGGSESIGGKKYARCSSLKSVDAVSSPAANPSGLFSVPTSFSDARARNTQGQFMGNEAGGAHPASMAAAYGGQAQQKRSQVQKILSALKLRKPVLPAQNPTLASRGRTINFMAKWSDGKKVQKGDRLSPKLDGIHVKATREGLFTKNGQPIKGQDHIRGDLESAHDHAVANGYEGVVVRRNDGKAYKKKSLQDSEYEVIGGSLGKKHGILHLKGDKGTFSVQAPRHIAEKAPLGKKATVAYQRLTNSGVPHSPIFKGVRHDMHSKRKLMAFNFAAPLDSQTRKSVDTTSRQSDEELMEQWGVAAQEMDRRNVLRLKAGMRPLSIEEVFDELQASRTRLRGFGALNSNDDQPSPLRDAAVGGLEGAAGYFVTDKLAHSLAPAGSGILRKAGVAGAVGAAGTMLAGSIMNQIAKRRQQQQNAPVMANPKQNGSFPRSGFSSTRNLIELAQKIDDGFRHDVGGAPLSGRITKDKYIKQLRDTDIANRDRDLAHAGIAGGAAGALINRGKLAKLSPLRRAGVGALTGAAAVEGIRAITSRHRDIYGDRSAEGKAAEHIPAVVAGGAAAGLGAVAARKLIRSKLGFSIIRRATQGAVSEAIELSNRDQKNNQIQL